MAGTNYKPGGPAPPKVPEVLCMNCQWNDEFHRCTNYKSHVRMEYACGKKGIWSIGNHLLLKDEPADQAGKDTVSVEFLRQHTSIPLAPQVFSSKDDENNRLFTLVGRVEGRTLADIWRTLTEEDVLRYAKEVAGYIMQLRNLHSETMGTVDGELLRDRWVLLGAQQDHVIGATEEEWWQDRLMPRLRGCSPETLKELKEGLPKCGPYTFTHGDLNAQNIIINNGHVAAIIDWELAGFYPVWWEKYSLRNIKNIDWYIRLSGAMPFLGEVDIDYMEKLRQTWGEQDPMELKARNVAGITTFCKCQPIERTELQLRFGPKGDGTPPCDLVLDDTVYGSFSF